jgi:hypothetical protein
VEVKHSKNGYERETATRAQE